MNLRSRVVGVLSAALLGLGGLAAHGQQFVGPGSTGEITLNISNAADSVSAVSGAAVSVKVVPAEFAASFIVDQANSVLGPVNLAVGGNQTFRVKYTIGQNPPEGSFEVILLATSAVEGILPERGTFDADSNIQDTSVRSASFSVWSRSGFARAFSERFLARKTGSVRESGASSTTTSGTSRIGEPHFSRDSCA